MKDVRDMLTYPGPNAITSLRQTYYPAQRRDSAARTAGEHKYDSASFSASGTERSVFMDTVSRLSQDVRTATTTGAIQDLRQQVASGTYAPDPEAIAGRILFLVGD